MAKDGTSKLTRQWNTNIRIVLFFLWPGQKLWSSMLLSSYSYFGDCNKSQQISPFLFWTKFILGISSSFMKSVWLGRHFFSQLLIHNFYRVTTGLHGISLTRTPYQKFCRSEQLHNFVQDLIFYASDICICIFMETLLSNSFHFFSHNPVRVSLKGINSLSIGANSEFLRERLQTANNGIALFTQRSEALKYNVILRLVLFHICLGVW